MSVIDPSTNEAKFVRGEYDGRLGARERQTRNGQMQHSGQSLQDAKGFGLPESIRGNPLGCGCTVAHLCSASPVVDGVIEADYQCDSDWHNYVVFEVRQNVNGPENSIKIDKFGNLVEESGVKTGSSLGEF